MISEMSNKISTYLIENGADESNAEVYAYGAECFLNLLISDGLLLVIGLLTHHVIYLLIWSVSFTLLRVNLGGLHASSQFWCILSGTIIGASSMGVSLFFVEYKVAAILCTLAAAIVAVIIAPVPHKNKKHIQKQRKKIKLKVAVTVSIECVIVCVLYFINPIIASYITSGVVMATIIGVAGVIFNPL